MKSYDLFTILLLVTVAALFLVLVYVDARYEKAFQLWDRAQEVCHTLKAEVELKEIKLSTGQFAYQFECLPSK